MPKVHQRALRPEEKEQILREYEQNALTLPQIGERHDINPNTVSDLAKAAKLSRTQANPYDEERHSWRLLVREYQRGATVGAVASQFAVGEDYVRLCLRRAGVGERTETTAGACESVS